MLCEGEGGGVDFKELALETPFWALLKLEHYSKRFMYDLVSYTLKWFIRVSLN